MCRCTGRANFAEFAKTPRKFRRSVRVGLLGGREKGVDMATYLTADEYSKALTTRLYEFYEALTFRWREEACKALSKTVFDVPGEPEPLRWQSQPESHGHVMARIASCPHRSWVRDGQVGRGPGGGLRRLEQGERGVCRMPGRRRIGPGRGLGMGQARRG